MGYNIFVESLISIPVFWMQPFLVVLTSRKGQKRKEFDRDLAVKCY